MPEAVYVLCALTALACAWLLLRSYGRSGTRLLLWAGACFVTLSVNNALLFVDLVLVPERDLSLVRTGIAVVGIGLMLYGLVWEGE